MEYTQKPIEMMPHKAPTMMAPAPIHPAMVSQPQQIQMVPQQIEMIQVAAQPYHPHHVHHPHHHLHHPHVVAPVMHGPMCCGAPQVPSCGWGSWTGERQFILIVVLFILLIIVGVSFIR